MAWNDLTNPEAWKSAMANLLRKGEDVGQYINQAPQKVGQSILDAGQRQQALMNEAFDPTGKTLIRNPRAANQAAINLLEGPLGFMPAGITAWHGSPHIFDKFDMSKVGTGEGAQAYGHGMYFAESPEVAKTYRKPEVTASSLNANSGKSYNSIQDFFDDVATNKGNLYKVDIPDEHIPMMLDWDKPLLEQTPQVQKALAKLGIKSDKQKLKEFDDALLESLFSDSTKSLPKQPMNPTGESIYQTVIPGNPKYTAEKLKEAGITGIRYLDQVSRGKGGTSNFVVFDPTDVKILERNNQPVTRKEILEEQVNKLK